jgi:hypothetical protein
VNLPEGEVGEGPVVEVGVDLLDDGVAAVVALGLDGLERGVGEDGVAAPGGEQLALPRGVLVLVADSRGTVKARQLYVTAACLLPRPQPGGSTGTKTARTSSRGPIVEGAQHLEQVRLHLGEERRQGFRPTSPGKSSAWREHH